MRRLRALLPLLVSILLVAATGAVAFQASGNGSREAEATHRRDRMTERDTLAGLVNQYFQFGFKEAFDYASTQDWALQPGHPGDEALLAAFVQRSALLSYGAAVVSLDEQVLGSWSRPPGLPPADDPGYRPLVDALLQGQPGLSSVMRVGSVPLVAMAVPIMGDGFPRAVLVAYFRTDESPLQTYNEKLRSQRPTARSMTVDSEQVVVTSTDRSLIGTRLEGNPALERTDAGDRGYLEFERDGEALASTFAPIGLGGWSSLDEQTMDAFYGGIRENQRRTELALLALLATAAAIALGLNHRVTSVRRRSEARYRAMVQNASDITTVVDAATRVLYDSPAMERALGYDPRERVGQSGMSFLHPDDVEPASEILGSLLEGPGAMARTELRVRHRDGRYIWFEVIATNLLDDPAVRGLVINLRDISERRVFQDELAHQAFHDHLTGLPNRALFHDRLKVALARRRSEGEAVAVLFVDLDRFKVVNDSLGHETGDQLLVAVGERLVHCLREEDTLARMSGDEFTILLDGVDGEHAAVMVAQRVIDELKRPFQVDGHELFAGASIGVALARPGQEPDDLVREADLAMYRAKERGRLRFEVFASDLGDRARQRMELESDLRKAIERDELRLHFQPEIDLADYRVVGFEALVRWEHPRRGLLLPGAFIGLAEETGLIVPVGAWVLEEATRQCRRWLDTNPDSPALRVSVNVSARQLQLHGKFVDTVAKALQDSNLDPRLLTLELTETVLLEDTDAAIAVLRGLRALGVELAIDDFGTGYSSLNYLKHFPISTLKLDRSFVQGLGDDSADAAIARSTIQLAHSLGIAVTAEGIELMEQLFQLQTMGCDRGQGYHFAKPMPADQVDPATFSTFGHSGA
jgi:diguanylate cyclase (GGDEF)-like protein/PAS domain S-box-containing protein